MQNKRDQIKLEMMLLPPMESFIPSDYRLRKIHQILDLSFVHEAVKGRYCQDNGRPSIDPEVVIRLFLLQALEGIRSVRELMREVQLHLGYRWFIGYGLEEKLPDHSTLSKALDRFGDEVFNDLFRRSVVQCQASGLVEGKVVHVDATTIRADLDKDKVACADSPDPDARFGRFPDGQLEPGYKQQTVVDDRKGVVVGLLVTSANKSDDGSLVEVIDKASQALGESPEVVCADGGYGSGRNRALCEDRGIRLVSPPQPAPRDDRGYHTVDQFIYDEFKDQFICPAGHPLHYAGRTGSHGCRRKYRGYQKVCRRCILKSECTDAVVKCLTVSDNHGALVRLRADSRTESFRRLYRRRAPVAEGVFAEAKQWHGLRRAWRRGLSKMRIQCLLVAAVINFKRLIAFFLLKNALGLATLEAFRRYCSDLYHNLLINTQSDQSISEIYPSLQN